MTALPPSISGRSRTMFFAEEHAALSQLVHVVLGRRSLVWAAITRTKPSHAPLHHDQCMANHEATCCSRRPTCRCAPAALCVLTFRDDPPPSPCPLADAWRAAAAAPSASPSRTVRWTQQLDTCLTAAGDRRGCSSHAHGLLSCRAAQQEPAPTNPGVRHATAATSVRLRTSVLASDPPRLSNGTGVLCTRPHTPSPGSAPRQSSR